MLRCYAADAADAAGISRYCYGEDDITPLRVTPR